MASNLMARYVWLIDQIRQHDGISKAEIDRLWASSNLNEGYSDDEIPIRTFRNYLHAIEEIFDINIECERKGGYKYYITDSESLEGDQLKNWLIDTVSTLNQVQSAPKLSGRIQYEDIPSGHRFLTAIIEAMRRNRTILITHRSFGAEETTEHEVEPYAVKVYSRRWYLIARRSEVDRIYTYGLDRILSIRILETGFSMPDDFSLEEYFDGCCGIIADKSVPVERILVRVFGNARAYVETLPLHVSQKRVEEDAESTTYEFRLRPDFNFYQAVISQLGQIEILEPEGVRREMFEYARRIMELHR